MKNCMDHRLITITSYLASLNAQSRPKQGALRAVGNDADKLSVIIMLIFCGNKVYS
jgi:hypothetical protein